MFFIFSITTYSHPGSLDSKGGHYCWKNCEDYGLNYGEYHYHHNNSSHNNITNKLNNNITNQENNNNFIKIALILFVIIVIILFLRMLSKKQFKKIDTTPRYLSKNININQFEKIKKLGYFKSFKIKRRGFFVATFKAIPSYEEYKIVGYYNEQIDKDKKYFIEGISSYNSKHGKHVKIDKVIKVNF